MKKIHLLAVLFVCLMLLSGCVGKTSAPRFVWPPPPEEPKLEWKGVYFSQDDIKKGTGREVLEGFLGGTANGRFSTPIGIVADGAGRVYVSDIHRKDVLIYDFNQGTVDSLSPLSGFVAPLGLAMDSKKNLYVADGERGQILVFDQNKTPILAFGKDDLEKPAYLAVNDELGRVYVSDSRKNAIVVFDLSGKQLFSFGEVGNKEGQFFAPQGLGFSPKGLLFVVDMFNARIQVFDPSGKFKYAFGRRNDNGGGFATPKDLAFDSEGHVYVVDGRRSIVNIFTDQGELLLELGDGKPSISQFGFLAPRSIFIDQLDQIYISEALGRRFAVWQYMSERYLQTNPYTAEDKERLLEHMTKVKKQAE